MATKTKKKVSTFQKTTDSIKSGIGQIHDEVLHTTDKLVDVSLQSGAKWQKLMGKVLVKGTDLLEKQQDMAFDTLEEVKSQYQSGNKRFKQLFSLDQSIVKKAAKLKEGGVAKARKVTKKVTNKVADTKQQLAETVEKVTTQDDLKALKGIGPKVESLLNSAGIKSYDQLANASVEALQGILAKAGTRFQSMDPTAWKELAKEALAKRSK